MTSKIDGKLQDHAYRTAFVSSQINIGIPFQIKALMKARGWTQEQVAERTGMLQPRISAILKPGKVRPNIETLRRFAEAFDCGLLVRFAPFSELARWSESFDPETFDVPQFEDDPGFKESENASAVVARTTVLTGLANVRLEDSVLFQQIRNEVVKAVQAYPEGLSGLVGPYKVETSKFSDPVTTSSWRLQIVYRNPNLEWHVSKSSEARSGVDYRTTPTAEERIA